MTKEQKEVLNHMSKNNIGAMPVNGKWIFMQGVRDSIEIAEILHQRIFGGAL